MSSSTSEPCPTPLTCAAAGEHDHDATGREALPCIIESERCMAPTTVNMVTTRDGNICFPCFGVLMAERVAPHLRVGVPAVE